MIVWTSALETGIRSIDLQHQELVGMINEMEAAHAAGHSPAALDEILPRLTVYALFHFGEEETLLAQVAEASAHADQHLREHRNFVEEVQRLIASRGTQNDHDLAEVLNLYLADWLILHITGTDRALARMLAGPVSPPKADLGLPH